MGTWIKETDKAIYLMQGGYYISKISKYPSKSNPNEKVLNVSGMKSWFSRADSPRGMTVSQSGPQPKPIPRQIVEPTKPGTRQTNSSGVNLIKSFEGLRLKAYQDAVGVWTIGYGHTSAAGPPTVYAGQTISEAEAESILQKDLELFENGVRNLVKVPINSDQFSALVSFSFNLGLGALGDSTLLRKLNAGDYQGAADEFPRWVKAGGQTLLGLVKRRDAERALFLSQPYAQIGRASCRERV